MKDKKICHWCGKEIESDILVPPIHPGGDIKYAHRECCEDHEVDGIPFCECSQYVYPPHCIDGKYIYCAMNGINAETDCRDLVRNKIVSLFH